MSGARFEKASRFIKPHELLPPEICKIIHRIADAMAPYEEYSRLIDVTDSGEQFDLHRVLDAEDVYTPELLNDIRRLGQRRCYFLDTYVNQHSLKGKAIRSAARRTDSVYATRVIAELRKRDRKLALTCLRDAANAYRVYAIGDIVRRHGLSTVSDFVRDRLMHDPDMQMIIRSHYEWYVLADTVAFRPAIEPLPLPGGLTLSEALEFVREIEFESLPVEQSLPFELPAHLQVPTIPSSGCMMINEDMDPRILAMFILCDPFSGAEMAWSLSRITGDIMLWPMKFSSIMPVISEGNAAQHFQYLRTYCMSKLLEALQSGQIKEKAYLSGGLTDRLREPFASSSAPRGRSSLRLPRTGEVLHLPGSMRFDRERDRVVVREGAVSWRRVMGTLKRCGVEIDFSHAHPKLRLNGRTTSYLNPHDKDQGHNRRVLYNTLAVLGISEEEFFRKL